MGSWGTGGILVSESQPIVFEVDGLWADPVQEVNASDFPTVNGDMTFCLDNNRSNPSWALAVVGAWPLNLGSANLTT